MHKALLKNEKPQCYQRTPIDINKFMKEQDNIFNMTNMSLDLPISKDQTNASFLQLGFQLFHYLSRCPKTIHFERCQYYNNIFNKDPSRTILEAAVEIENIDTSKKRHYMNLQTSLSHKIIDKLDAVEKYELDNLYILTSANPNNLRQIYVQNCLQIFIAV